MPVQDAGAKKFSARAMANLGTKARSQSTMGSHARKMMRVQRAATMTMVGNGENTMAAAAPQEPLWRGTVVQSECPTPRALGLGVGSEEHLPSGRAGDRPNASLAATGRKAKKVPSQLHKLPSVTTARVFGAMSGTKPSPKQSKQVCDSRGRAVRAAGVGLVCVCARTHARGCVRWCVVLVCGVGVWCWCVVLMCVLMCVCWSVCWSVC